MHEGRNVLDTAFEVGSESLSDLVVTLTDHPSEISGTIRDAAGQPVVDCTVVVFAADKQLWFPGGRGIGSVRPAADGRFRLPNLPAGDLLLAAVDDVEPGEWYNPQYLERLAVVATHVPLGPGDRKTADLRVVQLPK